MAISISLKEMLKCGVHYGHKASRWNPKMKKYIYGKRSGLHILDLEKTADCFVKALDFIHDQVSEGKNILFVATKLQTAEILSEYAKASSTPYVVNRWLGGTLTNFKTIKSRIKYFKDLESKMESGGLDKYTKKEKAKFQKELDTFERTLGGIRDLDKVPDLIFITDINADRIAITEAKKIGITVVGIADTNTDPSLVDYPIPSNDDAVNAMKYLLGIVNEVIVDAKKNPKKVKKEEKGEAKKKEMEVPQEIIAEKEEGVKPKKAAPKKKAVSKKKEEKEEEKKEKKEKK